MSTKIASVAAMLLMVLLPASRLFAYQTESQAQLPENQTGSTVRATGSATIDGKPVGQSSELSDFAILDSGDGSATITRKESTVLLGAGTRLALTENNLRLGCGHAAINTADGMSTFGPGYGISPKSSNARYEISQTPDHMRVISLEGDLWVFIGTREVFVPSGQSISIPVGCLETSALKRSLPGEMSPVAIVSQRTTVASHRFPFFPHKVTRTGLIVVAAWVGTAAIMSCVEFCGGSSNSNTGTQSKNSLLFRNQDLPRHFDIGGVNSGARKRVPQVSIRIPVWRNRDRP